MTSFMETQFHIVPNKGRKQYEAKKIQYESIL